MYINDSSQKPQRNFPQQNSVLFRVPYNFCKRRKAISFQGGILLPHPKYLFHVFLIERGVAFHMPLQFIDEMEWEISGESWKSKDGQKWLVVETRMVKGKKIGCAYFCGGRKQTVEWGGWTGIEFKLGYVQ